MIITETSNGSIAIVALSGTLDAASSPKLAGNGAIGNPRQTVVLDLEKVDFIDSSGLGAIIGALRKKSAMKAQLLLSCMNDRVRRVFEITNAQKLFHIFDDTAAAVEYAETR